LIHEIGRTRWLVETSCHDCYVDVEAFELTQERNTIEVGILTRHNNSPSSLKFRLGRAWRAFRGQADEFLTLTNEREADALLEVLFAAREEAFGAVEPPASHLVFGQG